MVFCVSELDLFHETTTKYKEQGSVEQSFNTIAGVGPNGSIIHYGDPKAEVKIKNTDMVLLDSGGYFDGGFATDTTRKRARMQKTLLSYRDKHSEREIDER